jgi:hypothetical protein
MVGGCFGGGTAGVGITCLGGDVGGVNKVSFSGAIALVRVVLPSEGCDFALDAGKGSAECCMKLTEATQATAAKAPTTAMMAGRANFRMDRRADDELLAPRLLLAPTEGGVAQVSKKRSVSPLIHLLMSPIVMLGIQKRCRTFWGSGASQFNPALQDLAAPDGNTVVGR